MSRHHDNVTLWLVKWLLFRLMFASGVVKLTYMDRTWWDLSALNWHYESQVRRGSEGCTPWGVHCSGGILLRGYMLWRWCGHCNLVVPGSSPLPCYSLDLFLVAPSSTPWLHFVSSQLVCLLPVGIFNHFMFVSHVCFVFVCIGPEKPHWGSGQLRLSLSSLSYHPSGRTPKTFGGSVWRAS